jgi:hypothetical protein
MRYVYTICSLVYWKVGEMVTVLELNSNRYRSQGSTVGIVTGYGPDGRGSEFESQ